MKVLEAQVQISAMDKTGSAFDSVAAKARTLDQALKNSGSATGTADGSKPAAKGERMDTSQVVAAGAAIGGVALEAERAFASFDRRLTRLGITAEATQPQTENMRGRARMISDRYGMPIEGTIGAMEDLAAQGKHYDEIMAQIDPIMRAATVSGADPSDIAKTSMALTDHFKIPIEQLPQAFDTLYGGGLMGKFELKDMARYLPMLAPLASSRGLTGQEGVAKMVSYLETIASSAPDASSTADWMLNILQKMDSDKTKKSFGDDSISGNVVNIAAALANARKDGKDQISVLLASLKEVTAGDDSKINQIFQDLQALLGSTALQKGEDRVANYNKQLANSRGMVDKNLPQLTNDAYASNQRFSNVVDTALVDTGSVIWKGLERFRNWANNNGEDLSGRHDMSSAQKDYVLQSRQIYELQEQEAAWQARAQGRRDQAASAGLLGKMIYEDQAKNADTKAASVADEIFGLLRKRAKLGPDAVYEDPWTDSPVNKKGSPSAAAPAPIDVTGKVQMDPASKATVQVNVKVDGGTVTGMSATGGGNIKANVGVSMAPGHVSRRDE